LFRHLLSRLWQKIRIRKNADFLSKPQAWHIIAAQRAVHIIKGGKPPLYLITRQRASCLRLDDIQCFALMIYRNELRMIYTPLA